METIVPSESYIKVGKRTYSDVLQIPCLLKYDRKFVTLA